MLETKERKTRVREISVAEQECQQDAMMCYRNMIRSRNSPPALTTVVMEMEVLGCWHGSRCILFMLLLAMKHWDWCWCSVKDSQVTGTAPLRLERLRHQNMLSDCTQVVLFSRPSLHTRLNGYKSIISELDIFLQLHGLFEVQFMPLKIISQTK